MAANPQPLDDGELPPIEALRCPECGGQHVVSEGTPTRLRCLGCGLQTMEELVEAASADGNEEQVPIEEGEPAGSEGRHVIQLEAGQLHVYADAAERLLAPDVYIRGQQLVRLGTAPELGRDLQRLVKRPAEQRVIISVNPEYLRRHLSARAEFQKFSVREEKWRAIDCPADLCRNILLAGNWKHFRPLEGIATAPFLRPDLTVCDTPGYDAASGVYYAPTAQFPPIPQSPTKDDAWEALARLREPFRQFPYAEGAEAAFLAHVLASAARHAIDTMPVFCYTAPIVASGKSLLASMASRIANGVEPGMSPYTDDGEELRKVLFAALIAGDSTIVLDNVPNGAKVRAPILCGFTTAAVYSDRRLGASERLTLPNRCGVLLTGNNITPAGDLARRCLVVRLDVNAETARGRQFAIANLKSYVAAHRPQLLADALTVLLAYAQTGYAAGIPKPLESFEQFSRVARDPLVWLDVGDAVETQQLETEDELAPLRTAFGRLAAHAVFGFKEFAARDVAEGCEGFVGQELKAAIEAAGCSDATSALKVGYWLREYRDRVAAGRKLVQAGSHAGSARWRLRQV